MPPFSYAERSIILEKKIWTKGIICLICMFGAIQAGFFMSKASAAEHNISMYYDGFTWGRDYSFTNPVDDTSETFKAGKDITRLWFKAVNSPAYCIEPGVRIGYGTTYSDGDTNYWAKLGYYKRHAISLALLYGYPNSTYLTDRSLGYALTQIVIWEYVLGYRDASTNVCTNRALIDNLSVPSSYQSYYLYYYNYLDNALMKHTVIPSFFSPLQRTAQTYTMKYNAASDDYEIILSDTNDLATLSDMNLSADGITFQILNDKTLKISSKNTISETAPETVKSTKKVLASDSSAMTAWSAPGMQEIITGGQTPDPPLGYMRLQTESTGNLKIQKHSEDGIISGRSFRIRGNGVDTTAMTDSSGSVTVSDLVAGSYQVEEINAPVQYNQPDTQTVAVLPGQTATADFMNTLKKSRVSFTKQDSYSGGFLSGAIYRIYKSDGTQAAELTSDADQIIYSPYLPYGDYYFQEFKSPPGFALDERKHPFSITENDQDLSQTLEDPPLSDVYPTFVRPNATYRNGTEIIASYIIHNNSYAEHAPDQPLSVHFSAYYYNKNGEQTNITTQQNSVAVPRSDENLTWFKVKIPPGVTKIYLTCTTDSPPGVVETNAENNTDDQVIDVSPSPSSQTPNTKFENVPPYFSRPDDNAEVPTGSYATNVTPNATWQQWVYENGAWGKRTYGMTLTADQQIAPDVNAFSSFRSGGFWHMKSGYGVSLTANTGVSRYGSAILPDAGAYVLPQNGNAYFPEFGYEPADGKYRTLQLTASNKLEFEPNPYSITAQGEHDGRRVHYTPLWYPDGNYTVKTYLYDCWTPAGMISLQNTLNPVVIGSNIYNDWVINHK